MDGNHSLLDGVSHLIHCADVQPPLIINIVLGLPANIYVIWLILAGPGNKAAEIFSLNLALCEVAINIANVASLIALNTEPNVANCTYLLYGIKFYWGFIFAGRPLFMTCICLERYLAVVHPLTYLKYKLLRYRLAGIIMSWLIVMVCCIILVWVPFTAIDFVTFGMAFTWFLGQFFCCVETLCALVRPGPGEGNLASNGMNSAKLKAFRIVLIIFVGTTLCYLPYITAIILFDISKEVSTTLLCISSYIALIAGIIPSLLYIFRAGKMQNCINDTCISAA